MPQYLSPYFRGLDTKVILIRMIKCLNYCRNNHLYERNGFKVMNRSIYNIKMLAKKRHLTTLLYLKRLERFFFFFLCVETHLYFNAYLLLNTMMEHVRVCLLQSLDAVRGTMPPNAPLSAFLAKGLSHAGVSITVTSVTDIMAFAVGSIAVSIYSFVLVARSLEGLWV